MTILTQAVRTVSLLLTVTLSACGGGGGSASPDMPVPLLPYKPVIYPVVPPVPLKPLPTEPYPVNPPYPEVVQPAPMVDRPDLKPRPTARAQAKTELEQPSKPDAEIPYCDGNLPAGGLTTASSQTMAQSVLSRDPPITRLVVKLRASSIGSDDTNNPEIVYAAVRRALLAVARSDPGNVLSPEAAQAAVHFHHRMSGGVAVVALGQSVAMAQADALASMLMLDPLVDYAESDVPNHLMAETPKNVVPSNPLIGQQWYLNTPDVGINAASAWAIQETYSDVVTAIIDGGYTEHANMRYNRLSNGMTLTGNQSGTMNMDGVADWRDQHGLKVAGVMSADTDNGVGMAGVGWNAKYIPINVFSSIGAFSGDVADAMRWAVGLPVPGAPFLNPHPAKILNLSLGSKHQCNRVYQDAIDEVVLRGATVIVAAGNENMPASFSQPANCRNVIAVGGTNEKGQRHSVDATTGSNYGRAVTVSAPGVDILTLKSKAIFGLEDSFEKVTGTSFAAPQVSGIVAMLLSANPALSPNQVKRILVDTARKPKLADNQDLCKRPEGAGIVDAGAAVRSAQEMADG